VTRRIRWGVLGVARIATLKVVPAMQGSALGEVVAIASRDPARAEEAARALGIPRAYGSYEALLADAEVDAVYNPLPNHLHVPWSVRALEAGRHVLCEKPVALDAAEAQVLLAARDRTGLLVQEAFMVRTHPQWVAVRDLLRSGRAGALRAVATSFAYANEDPANVRNVRAYGGGALLDIGCYPVTLSRYLFGAEPRRVSAVMDRDPRFGTDRLVSGILDFAEGTSVFTCGTQMAPHQRVQVLATRARIEVEVPFNAPNDRPTRVLVDDGRDVFGGGIGVLEFSECDQYRIQADLFARAILDGAAAPLPLEDSVLNMRVLDALARAAESGRWESP
jgi:predicted dehydrogenase